MNNFIHPVRLLCRLFEYYKILRKSQGFICRVVPETSSNNGLNNMKQFPKNTPSIINSSRTLHAQSYPRTVRGHALRDISLSISPVRLWLCVIALVLLPALMHGPFLLGIFTIDPLPYFASAGEIATPWKGTPFIDPNVGWQAQALGKLAADQWLSGQVPWWNFYNGAGLPLAAEAQPGALFLPFVLLYHFRQGIVWVAILLQIIAGLSTFALLRKIRLMVLASFVGAVLYEFNGTFAWHGAPIISPIAFLPLLLFAIEYWHGRVENNQLAKRAWVWIAPVLAWSLYSGFPETAYLNGLLAVVWALARLTDLERSKRWLYMRGLLYGVGCGLLLSLPLIIPFQEMISLSFVGEHNGNFSHASLPTAAAAHSLMPWLFGPIGAYFDTHNILTVDWGWIAGYFPALQVVLALLGVWLMPRKLSFCLLGWMILCLARSFGWWPISDFVNLVPLVKSIIFSRYAGPSWEFAGAVLCALAIHAIQLGGVRLRIRYHFTLTMLVIMAISAGLLVAIAGLIKEMLLQGPAPWTIVLALAWWVGSVGLASVLFLVANKRSTLARGLTVLLMADALLAFAMPLVLSSTKPAHVGEGVAWLQSHQVEGQRIYGLRRVLANYGAYFKLAQINYNYLPVPNAWVSFVHERLYPNADEISFSNPDDYPTPVQMPAVLAALHNNLAAYEQIGVRYIVAEPETALFTDTIAQTSSTMGGHQQAFSLGHGSVVIVNLPLPEQARGKLVNQIQIMIGNYNNTSNGVLHVQVCNAAQVCAAGERSLSQSIDNNLFTVTLNNSLPVASTSAGTTPPMLMVQIQQQAFTHPVAIWMWPLAQGVAGQGVTVRGISAEFAGMGPDMQVQYSGTAEMGSTALVYQGHDMDIYELLHAAPYFEADDTRCHLTPASRLALNIQCPAATTLTRKEMDYPGWQARIDGQDAPITLRDKLFQSIQIPAGSHRVDFSYVPSHRPLWLGGFLIGLVILLINLWRELKGRALFATAFRAAHEKSDSAD